MAGRYYFLLTSLPALPVLGEPSPIDLPGFRQLIAGEPPVGEVIDALLLEGDLLSRESAMAGEGARSEPVVLSAGQVSGEEPLPAYLVPDSERRSRLPADMVWDAYYRHAIGRGRAGGCPFVEAWVGFEVALRNALAAQRAKRLQLDPGAYLVAADLADPAAEAEVQELAGAWAAAADPLSALKVLDEGRWTWTEEHSRYYSFAVDELAAYARKLILITRWHLLAREGASRQVSQDAP